MEEVTGDVCGQDGCRERRYYLENGVWFCRQGHQQEVWLSAFISRVFFSSTYFFLGRAAKLLQMMMTLGLKGGLFDGRR